MDNCYKSGRRIPREKLHDQDERLSNRHIQTLQFVQEVVNENKELKQKVEELELRQINCKELHALAEESKEKIQRIQEQYLKRADEINAMLAEKHRIEMMQTVNEKLEQEKTYCEEIAQLKAEIGRLEQTNKELMARSDAFANDHELVESLNMEIEDFKRMIADQRNELDALRNENELLSGEKSNQFSEIQHLQELRSQNEHLSHQLRETMQKNMELNYKVNRLEKDLAEASNSTEQIEMIDSLKNKLAKLHKEKSVGSEKEAQFERMISDLKHEVAHLRETLKLAEVTKARILEEYHRVVAELNALKMRHAGDNQKKTFKDFVALKREMNVLKDENDHLKHKLKNNIPPGASLPFLKSEEQTTSIVKVTETKATDKKKKEQLSIKMK